MVSEYDNSNISLINGQRLRQPHIIMPMGQLIPHTPTTGHKKQSIQT